MKNNKLKNIKKFISVFLVSFLAAASFFSVNPKQVNAAVSCGFPLVEGDVPFGPMGPIMWINYLT
jgi:hypothetical protein